ncbi:hypothetical protein Neosp_015083 [[Neocosmospora] mangrovei]
MPRLGPVQAGTGQKRKAEEVAPVRAPISEEDVASNYQGFSNSLVMTLQATPPLNENRPAESVDSPEIMALRRRITQQDARLSEQEAQISKQDERILDQRILSATRDTLIDQGKRIEALEKSLQKLEERFANIQASKELIRTEGAGGIEDGQADDDEGG